MKPYQFTTLLLCLNGFLFSQNLVTNGSFENHEDVRCTNCYNKTQFEQILPGWSFTNWAAPCICDKQYDIYSHNVCNLSKFPPRDGETDIELFYSNSGVKYAGCDENQGYAIYLQTKLSQPLSIDKVYRIQASFNVFKSASYPAKTEYARYIGIDLMSKKFKEPFNNHACTHYSYTPFLLDTTVSDTWVDKTWYIKPTAVLNFINIGMYWNESWKPILNKLKMEGRYAVDNISIHEVPENSITKDSIFEYPFLNKPLQPIVKIEKKKIPIEELFYFDLDKAELTTDIKMRLDSLFTILKNDNFKTVIDIVGHTDSTGTADENRTLSLKRAQVIQDYLIAKGVPFYCQNISYKSASEPIASNNTEGGRKRNRRTELVTSQWRLSEQFYYYASKYAEAQNADSAFFYLKKWFQNENTTNTTIIFLDDDLIPLKKDARWTQLYNDIKASFGRFKNPELAFQLDSLYSADQLLRTIHFEDEKKYEPKKYDTLSTQASSYILMNKLNIANLAILKPLLKKYGWPKISEVGKKSAKTAYYIIDHSEINTMKAYLPYLESTCKANEADWEWYATLYDRIQMYDKKPQKYGTQYIPDPKNPNHYILHPLVDAEKVNAFRKELGIAPISTYEFNIKVRSK